ncbi:hypothetical protein ACF1G0_11490 [Streptomyces sp. NPDC013953]
MVRKLHRSTALAAVSVLFSASGVVFAHQATAAPAAYPECWVQKESAYTASAGCRNIGTAKYRVRGTCINNGGATWTLTGPWVRSGVSRATCSANQTSALYGQPEFEIG